jgi:hypothetical protein
MEIFSPTKIIKWCSELDSKGKGVTAICPRCNVDSIIGESSGQQITSDFLKAMYSHAFALKER